jgi:hypothetical protein
MMRMSRTASAASRHQRLLNNVPEIRDRGAGRSAYRIAARTFLFEEEFPNYLYKGALQGQSQSQRTGDAFLSHATCDLRVAISLRDSCVELESMPSFNSSRRLLRRKIRSFRCSM